MNDRRPSQRFASRRIIANDLISDYDAVSIILRKRMSHGLQVDTHYTWSKTRDMGTHSNGGGQTMNNYDTQADYGPANWDIPHRFVASYIYDVPFFRDSSNAFLKHAVGGWQVAGVTTIQSGIPANVTVSGDPANIGINNQQRPNLVGEIPKMNCQEDPATRQQFNCYDASAFTAPAPFTFGNAPRNVLRGPKFVTTDLSFGKTLPLGGPARVQVRAEIFNIFNNVNLGNPNTVFGSASFGRISTMNLINGDMRRIQLGARLLF